VLITALVSLPVSAVAPAAPSQLTQERFSVPFTIPFGFPCADLPPGVTEISGVAEFFVRITGRLDNDGVLHLNINATAFGTATDNNGVVYSFNYANHFSVDVPANEFPQPFKTNDHFNLNGKGQASHMHLGFVVVGTALGPDDFVTDTINVRGDAFDCDPI
jgi:hypothetical protein